MASSKHKHQTNERFRQNDIRVTNLEGKLERLCAIVDNRIIHSADNEEQYPEPVLVPEPVAEPVAEPVKAKRICNTFEKKTMHKDWCARLCAIRAECCIPVETVCEYREGTPQKVQINWKRIQHAAGLEIQNNNIKQGLPNPSTILTYVERLHLIVLIAAHKAAMAGLDTAKIYTSRADLLVEIRDEIHASYPKVEVRSEL
mgnify:CR=1 FL=1